MLIEEEFSVFVVMWLISYCCNPFEEEVQGSNLVCYMNFFKIVITNY